MKINYCLECGSKLAKENQTTYKCPRGHYFWNNPKCAVGVIFRRGKDMLYAIRAHQPCKGMLDVVGGFLDYNESPLDACVREVHEETGLTINPKHLVFISTYTAEYTPNTTTVTLVYECTDWDGEFVPNDDAASYEWKPTELITGKDFAWKSRDLPNVLSKIKARG